VETNAAQASSSPRKDATAGSLTVAPDRTELSGVADRLTEILQADSGARAERIQQLKETVASGAYHVDSAALSHAIVNEALSSGSNDTAK
jgi:flagellar biosynthesis anti-sigma factor FlgM